MKIPVTYLILTLIVFGTLVWMRAGLKQINEVAIKSAMAQEVKDVKNYQTSVNKVTDVNFATKRGLQFLKNGDTQKATAMLAQATRLDQNYREAWFYAGYAYLEDLKKRQSYLSITERNKILDSAKYTLTQAQKIDPLYSMTYKLLAVISENENDDKSKSLWYARYETVTGAKLIETTKTIIK